MACNEILYWTYLLLAVCTCHRQFWNPSWQPEVELWYAHLHVKLFPGWSDRMSQIQDDLLERTATYFQVRQLPETKCLHRNWFCLSVNIYLALYMMVILSSLNFCYKSLFIDSWWPYATLLYDMDILSRCIKIEFWVDPYYSGIRFIFALLDCHDYLCSQADNESSVYLHQPE